MIKIVGQIQPARDETQFLGEHLGSKPGLAEVQFVLTDQACRKTVEQRQSAGLQIRRRTAKTDDIGEEHRMLCDARREKQIRRG